VRLKMLPAGPSWSARETVAGFRAGWMIIGRLN